MRAAGQSTSRYPQHLEALQDKWWTDESTLETLAALTVWRAELDETRQDPRDELAFQTQLTDYTQHLRQKRRRRHKDMETRRSPARVGRELSAISQEVMLLIASLLCRRDFSQ